MSDPRSTAIEAGAEALFANNASEWSPIAKTKKAVRYRDDLGAIYDAMAPLIRQATADEIDAANDGRATDEFQAGLRWAADLIRWPRVGRSDTTGGDDG